MVRVPDIVGALLDDLCSNGACCSRSMGALGSGLAGGAGLGPQQRLASWQLPIGAAISAVSRQYTPSLGCLQHRQQVVMINAIQNTTEKKKKILLGPTDSGLMNSSILSEKDLGVGAGLIRSDIPILSLIITLSVVSVMSDIGISARKIVKTSLNIRVSPVSRRRGSEESWM